MAQGSGTRDTIHGRVNHHRLANPVTIPRREPFPYALPVTVPLNRELRHRRGALLNLRRLGDLEMPYGR